MFAIYFHLPCNIWFVKHSCCCSKKPSDFNVHVGTTFLNETGQVRKVKSLHYHEDFDMFYLKNDIGVIILEEDLEFGKSVQSLKLCRKNITAGTPAILSGWGKIEVRKSENKKKMF